MSGAYFVMMARLFDVTASFVVDSFYFFVQLSSNISEFLLLILIHLALVSQFLLLLLLLLLLLCLFHQLCGCSLFIIFLTCKKMFKENYGNYLENTNLTQLLSDFLGNVRHEFMPGILGWTSMHRVIYSGYKTSYESKKL